MKALPNKKDLLPELKLGARWNVHYLLTILVIVVLSMIVYMGYNAIRISEGHAPLVDAAMEIKLEATTAHLWFEEIISGDRHEDLIEDVWARIDAAEWYANAMLVGDENEEGKFIPLDDPKLRSEIQDVEGQLAKFRNIMDERMAVASSAGIGSEVDQRYHAVFNDFITQADEVETALQAKIAARLRSFRYTQYSLMGIVAALFVLAVFVFRKYEREKAEAFRIVQAARQRAEASERWLSTTLNSIGDGVIATNVEGKITRMNPTAEDLTGWAFASAQNHPLPEVFHIINAMSRERVEDPVEKVLREGGVVGLANHTVLISKDGTERQIADSGAPIRTEEGEILGVVLVFRDVTEAYRMQQAARESEKRYRNLFDGVPAGLNITTPDGQYLDANVALVEILDYPDQETLLATNAIDLYLNPEDRQRWQAMIEKKGAVRNLETQLRRHDGKVIWVKSNVHGVRGDDGQVLFYEGSLEDITERKQVEEALRTSEANLVKAQQITHVGSWTWDLENDKVTWSDEMYRIYGLDSDKTLDPLTAEVIFKMTHPDDIDRVQKNAQRGLKEGKPIPIEYRILRPDKTVRIIYAEGDLEFDTSGKPIRMFGTVQDITERVRTEEALRESENKLKEAQAMGQIGNWEYDIENQKIMWSDQVYVLYERDPALGPPTVEEEAAYYSPEQDQILKEYARRVIEEGKEFAYDLRARMPSGKQTHFTATMRPIKDKIGRTTKIFGTVQNITERVRAEEALRVSEERFDLAVHGSNAGIWDWDIQNNSLYWSPRMKELLGYADDELEIDFEAFESHLHPDDREHTEAAIESHLKDRRLFDVEQRLRTKSGEYRWFNARGQALWDEAGKPLRMLGSTTDITERVRAQEQLKAALADKTVLLREVHHRVKNNLQTVISLLNLQANQIEDERALSIIRASQSRVYSMAQVHAELHRSSDLAHVDFSHYVQGLVSQIFPLYQVSAADITIHVEFAEKKQIP